MVETSGGCLSDSRAASILDAEHRSLGPRSCRQQGIGLSGLRGLGPSPAAVEPDVFDGIALRVVGRTPPAKELVARTQGQRSVGLSTGRPITGQLLSSFSALLKLKLSPKRSAQLAMAAAICFSTRANGPGLFRHGVVALHLPETLYH